MSETIRIEKDPSSMAAAAAKLIKEKIQKATQEGKRFSFALSGGKTPIHLYQCLSKSTIDWKMVDLFWSDERHVPPSHPDSNYLMAYENLISKISIPEKNIHRIKSELAPADDAANDYEKVLKNYFGDHGSSSPFCFDLVLLGMGHDGHTASLFPDGPTCDQWVCAPWIAKLNAHRITLTPDILNRSKDIIILAVGKEKAKILGQILTQKDHLPLYPIELIKPKNGNLIWLLDKNASLEID